MEREELIRELKKDLNNEEESNKIEERLQYVIKKLEEKPNKTPLTLAEAHCGTTLLKIYKTNVT